MYILMVTVSLSCVYFNLCVYTAYVGPSLPTCVCTLHVVVPPYPLVHEVESTIRIAFVLRTQKKLKSN